MTDVCLHIPVCGAPCKLQRQFLFEHLVVATLSGAEMAAVVRLAHFLLCILNLILSSAKFSGHFQECFRCFWTTWLFVKNLFCLGKSIKPENWVVLFTFISQCYPSKRSRMASFSQQDWFLLGQVLYLVSFYTIFFTQKVHKMAWIVKG